MTDKVEQRNTEMVDAAESLGISQEEYDKIVDECIFGKEEPVSEELNKAAEAYIADENNYSHSRTETFKAGAQWYKQQMMKNAVDGVCSLEFEDGTGAVRTASDTNFKLNGLHCGDKVKLIVIKQD